MNRTKAEGLINEARQLNDGPWINHSYNVACLAERIADKAGMDSDKAYIVGLLHDIGRRNGTMQARHALEGYRYLSDIGYEEGARICMTHTFQCKDVDGIYDNWDCNEEELHFISEYLNKIQYDDYDKLFQTENRSPFIYSSIFKSELNYTADHFLLSVAVPVRKRQCIAQLDQYFDSKTGVDIYTLF